MKYMGSKARFVKEILPIILKGRTAEQWYVEPFAGGMNTICEVGGNRIANDKNIHLIYMWIGLCNGEEYPKEISKELYDIARDVFNKQEKWYDNTIKFENYGRKLMTLDVVGWIGWMGSANGRKDKKLLEMVTKFNTKMVIYLGLQSTFLNAAIVNCQIRKLI